MDLTDFRSREAFFKPVSGFKTSVKKEALQQQNEKAERLSSCHMAPQITTFKEHQKRGSMSSWQKSL